MPRTERPLDDDGGALTNFAADLRRLRAKAGKPPYRQLAREAHYSSTTLADAAGGRILPSLAVTLAYARARGGDPEEWEKRWHSLATELTAAKQESTGTGSTADDQHNPYAGLAEFQPEDAERFFGRERLTDDLVSRVRAGRFLAVFGASGSGKSSLLRAGLLPRIRSGEATGIGWPTHPRALRLAVLQALADQRPEVELLWVVDQFEEAFTLCRDQRERARFITALVTAATAANSRTRVAEGCPVSTAGSRTTMPGQQCPDDEVPLLAGLGGEPVRGGRLRPGGGGPGA